MSYSPNLYNAGLITSNFNMKGRIVTTQLNEQERGLRGNNRWYLESYHYVKAQRAVDKIRADGIKVFLDSGAFSAYTQGETIDLGAFCDYCHENKDIIDMVSVLDVIDFDDPKRAAKMSYLNLMEMERRGIRAMPCYHQGENPEVLEHYVKNYDYITIGGLVGSSADKLRAWLDGVWERYIIDGNGIPKTKVHLFGITSLPLMRRYNATSFDSSTWVQWGAHGLILLPRRGEQLNISARSSSRKNNRQHLDTLRPLETEHLENEIRECGACPQRMRDNNYARWAWNSWAFPEYLRLNPPPAQFMNEQPGLF